MAICNVCGFESDSHSDLVLNKLFICKGIPSIICDNLCKSCYYWLHKYLNIDPAQPFYTNKEWNERLNLHAICR